MLDILRSRDLKQFPVIVPVDKGNIITKSTRNIDRTPKRLWKFPVPKSPILKPPSLRRKATKSVTFIKDLIIRDKPCTHQNFNSSELLSDEDLDNSDALSDSEEISQEDIKKFSCHMAVPYNSDVTETCDCIPRALSPEPRILGNMFDYIPSSDCDLSLVPFSNANDNSACFDTADHSCRIALGYLSSVCLGCARVHALRAYSNKVRHFIILA